MNEEKEMLTEEEVMQVIDYANEMYMSMRGVGLRDYIGYNSALENKILIEANNNPLIPNYDKIKNALANYTECGDLLQSYSEFMNVWDGIYNQILDYKINLLAFDITKHCTNVKDSREYNSRTYKEDCERVKRFFENFNAKSEFRDVVKNMLLDDTYFCWLRDSSGTFSDEPIDLSQEPNSYTLQMMPQSFCRISGEFTAPNMKGKGFLWDIDSEYFLNPSINILNYDPSLVRSLDTVRKTNKVKNFITDDGKDLNKVNSYLSDNYIRTKVNNGAYCFKYNSYTFAKIPPMSYILKNVFHDDFIEKLQRDKDMISANALIVGELKTRNDKDMMGMQKNPFTIDPKTVGKLMALARNGINKAIKAIPLPLEETRLYQFADNNSNMYKNQLATNSGLGVHNPAQVFTTDNLAQEQAQIASTIDFNSIAQSVYPQFESFLNFFVNKKTKYYKFRFKVSGSTLPFLRQKDIDNHVKFMDKGINPTLGRIGTLLGYDENEFEAMVLESRHSDIMQDSLYLLMNTNTTNGSDMNDNGRPKSEDSDLSDNGATSREYLSERQV